MIFLSTLSLRRATFCPVACSTAEPNFYPRSPCGERLVRIVSINVTYDISIHALLAESDFLPGCLFDRRAKFLSTLSLRRATASRAAHSRRPQFLSTLSLRRATSSTKKPVPASIISIHALLAESDLCNCLYPMRAFISIHALLAESDLTIIPHKSAPVIFLSTLSLRRATLTRLTLILLGTYFYPRSPCGERHLQYSSAQHSVDFYPRSPCGERLCTF